MQEMIYPYCGEWAKLIDSSEIFGKSYGMIFACVPCDARVGIHKVSGKPLGTLADGNPRKLRSLAHKAFDPIWRKSKLHNARSIVYTKLSKKTMIHKSKCHI